MPPMVRRSYGRRWGGSFVHWITPRVRAVPDGESVVDGGLGSSPRWRRVGSSACISAVGRMAAALTIWKVLSVTTAGIMPPIIVRFSRSFRRAGHLQGVDRYEPPRVRVHG